MGGRRGTPAERLWRRTVKTETCWLWTGATDGKYGHGRLNVDGRPVQAHRVAWADAFGAVPAGMSVLHKCDVALCVNPAHLFLGTQADNMADMTSKGRRSYVGLAVGRRWWPRRA